MRGSRRLWISSFLMNPRSVRFIHGSRSLLNWRVAARIIDDANRSRAPERARKSTRLEPLKNCRARSA